MIFGNQGALWGNAMTWWDHDTGSIWSQPLGKAIAGPRAEEEAALELVPITYTTWDAWLEAHPDTLALDAPGGTTRFDLDEMLVVADFGDEAVGWAWTELASIGVHNDTVAGMEVAIVTDPLEPQRWAVFSRRLEDHVITLGVDGVVVTDWETGSIWDPNTGLATSGPLQGELLARLPAFTSFPGDFNTFWPDGRVWP